MAVHEQKPPEALIRERVEQIEEQCAVRLDAQGWATRIRREIRRQTVGQRREHEDTQRLGGLDRDALGEDAVDPERQVRVLFDGAERDDDAVVPLQVVLDLHPVAVLDLHRVDSS
jgi:hypothetical protein